MTILGIAVGTGLGMLVGFGLGRLKAWQRKIEYHDKTLLQERLRLKGLLVK